MAYPDNPEVFLFKSMPSSPVRERERKRETKSERERQRGRERESKKRGSALSVPHSVSQSACVIIWFFKNLSCFSAVDQPRPNEVIVLAGSRGPKLNGTLSEVDGLGLDLGILISCKQLIISYSTFGMWAGTHFIKPFVLQFTQLPKISKYLSQGSLTEGGGSVQLTSLF